MKRKMNLLDYCILVLVIVVVSIFAYKQVSDRYSRFESGGDLPELETMTYTYVVEGVREMSVEAVKEGAILFDEDSRTELGTVTEKYTTPYYDWIYNTEGDYKKVEVPGKYNLYITVEGRVIETEDRYLAQGVFELKVNSKIKLATQLVGFEGKLAYFND